MSKTYVYDIVWIIGNIGKKGEKMKITKFLISITLAAVCTLGFDTRAFSKLPDLRVPEITLYQNASDTDTTVNAVVAAQLTLPMPSTDKNGNPLTVPTRDGYVFNGYYDQRQGGIKYYNQDMTPTERTVTSRLHNLYAQWATAIMCNNDDLGVSSGSTGLDAIWNIVNKTCNPGQYFDMTTATCVTCSANSYCPGGTYNVESQTNGLNSCPIEYGLSATGTSTQTDCYRTCTTNDVAHSTGVSGGYYYGNNNQCVATSCAAGWHLTSFLEDEYAAANNPSAEFALIHPNGEYYKWPNSDFQQSENGLTQPNTWAVKYDSMGIVYGAALCSKTPGDSNGSTWSNPTTFNSLTDESGQDGARYCYCKITGYKPVSGNMQSLSRAWIFFEDKQSQSGCSSSSSGYCTYQCATYAMGGGVIADKFRPALFAAGTSSLASCEANTINIKWYNEGNVHDENTCTYAESVTLPETDPQRTGYNFTGWTVRPNTTPNE